jgi:hypothetical protein
VIISNLPLLVNVRKKDTLILLSGMLHKDIAVITASLLKHDIAIKNIHEYKNWIIILSDIMH